MVEHPQTKTMLNEAKPLIKRLAELLPQLQQITSPERPADSKPGLSMQDAKTQPDKCVVESDSESQVKDP
jgi:hypothetical protein